MAGDCPKGACRLFWHGPCLEWVQRPRRGGDDHEGAGTDPLRRRPEGGYMGCDAGGRGSEDPEIDRCDRADRRGRRLPHRSAYHRGGLAAAYGSGRPSSAAADHGPRECRLGRGGRQGSRGDQGRRSGDRASENLGRHLSRLPPRLGHAWAGHLSRARLQWRLCRISRDLRAQHRRPAEDAGTEGGGALCRCGSDRLSRGEEGDPAPAARRERRRDRRGRSRPYRDPVPEGDVRGRRDRGRQVRGLAGARRQDRRRPAGQGRRQRGRGGARLDRGRGPRR